MEAISDQAQGLYKAMVDHGGYTTFLKQSDLESYIQVESTAQLSTIIQELINNSLVKLGQVDREVVYRAQNTELASKIATLTTDEALVFEQIVAAGREGVWSRVIRQKTALPSAVVTKALRRLEIKRYVRGVQDVKAPTHKTFMLYELQPSSAITGGPWYTDGELDREFVGYLYNVVWQFVASKTFPDLANAARRTQLSYPVSYASYPTVKDVLDHITTSGVSKVELGVADIRSICELLVFDDLLERIDRGQAYKATWNGVMKGLSESEGPGDQDGYSESACGRCPVFDVCGDDGPVNIRQCVYYDEWLK